MGSRVQGLRLGVEGFRVWVEGFRVCGLWFHVSKRMVLGPEFHLDVRE